MRKINDILDEILQCVSIDKAPQGYLIRERTDILLTREDECLLIKNDYVSKHHWLIREMYDHYLYCMSFQQLGKWLHAMLYDCISGKFTIDDVKKSCNQNFKTEHMTTTTPISGIMLQKNTELKLGCFLIKKDFEKYTLTIAFNAIPWRSDFYLGDLDFLHEKSTNIISDFIRLLHYMLPNAKIKIIAGSARHNAQDTYVVYDNFEYHFDDIESYSKDFYNLLTLDYEYIMQHPLWLMYEKYNVDCASDLEIKIIDTMLAIGESNRCGEVKNAILYSCIALETLFTFKVQERELFREGITVKLADSLAYFIHDSYNERMEVISVVKEVYKIRSNLVHGNNKIGYSYIRLNSMLMHAIQKLLSMSNITTSNEFKDFIQKIKYQ